MFIIILLGKLIIKNPPFYLSFEYKKPSIFKISLNNSLFFIKN